MKLTKIKDEWVEYNYAINCSHTALESITEALENNGYRVEYLGKSKVFQIDDEIHHLPKRSLFFKIYKQEYST